MTVLRSAGSSTSATPTTQVAEIASAVGKVIVGWTLFAGQSSGASTQTKIIVTYTDNTTTEFTAAANTTLSYQGNAGGLIQISGAAAAALSATFAAKPVKKIRVETAGTGTGTRYGEIAGWEEDEGVSTVFRASGSSTAAAGALIAEIERTGSNALLGWSVFTGQVGTSATTRLIVTYTDDDSTTVDTASGSTAQLMANAGGVIRYVGNVPNLVTALAAKAVKKIRLETLGSSSSNARFAVVSAFHAGPMLVPVGIASETDSSEAITADMGGGAAVEPTIVSFKKHINNNGTSVSITFDESPQAGDAIVLLVSSSGSGSNDDIYDAQPAEASGFTKDHRGLSSATRPISIASYVKKAAGTEGATFTITHSLASRKFNMVAALLRGNFSTPPRIMWVSAQSGATDLATFGSGSTGTLDEGAKYAVALHGVNHGGNDPGSSMAINGTGWSIIDGGNSPSTNYLSTFMGKKWVESGTDAQETSWSWTGNGKAVSALLLLGVEGGGEPPPELRYGYNFETGDPEDTIATGQDGTGQRGWDTIVNSHPSTTQLKYSDDWAAEGTQSGRLTFDDAGNPFATFSWNMPSRDEMWLRVIGKFVSSNTGLQAGFQDNLGENTFVAVASDVGGNTWVKVFVTSIDTATTTFAVNDVFRFDLHVVRHPTAGVLEARIWKNQISDTDTYEEIGATGIDTGDAAMTRAFFAYGGPSAGARSIYTDALEINETDWPEFTLAVTPVNWAEETDTAQTVGKAKAKALTAGAETDSSQAITRRKTKAIGIASETDSSQALTRRKTKTISAATETDTAQAITRRKSRTISAALETDSAQAITASFATTISPAFEVDSAQPIGRSRTKAISAATETDTAQAVGRSKQRTISAALETDSSQAITHTKVKAISAATETDSAQSLTRSKAKAITAAAETDTAQAVTASFATAINPALETDSAEAITHTKTQLIGIAQETDSAEPVTVSVAGVVNTAFETDSAEPITAVKPYAVGMATESNTARQIQNFGAPWDLVATPISGDRIDLDWSPVYGAVAYDIERDGVVIEEYFVGTHYEDEGLDQGTQYDYRVKTVANA